jgi:hypothetical protein
VAGSAARLMPRYTLIARCIFDSFTSAEFRQCSVVV